jgi:acetate kinase
MTQALVVINGGSSSIKFTLFALHAGARLEVLALGAIEKLNSSPHLQAYDHDGALLSEQTWPIQTSHDVLLAALIDWIDAHLDGARLVAAGHRVAHGGMAFSAPVVITPAVLAGLQALIPLAPMHQPHNLAPIEALQASHPGLVQVACFDTAFHGTNPQISRLYGLPRALSAEGLRHYGFHGLSYEFIAQALPAHAEQAPQARVIVAHLGSGASLCAMVGGRSVASTMGFSALDGVPMGTRCGAIDPGILLYLLKEKNLNANALETLLYQQSGLLGVSGISNDVRTLLASAAPEAREAIDLFVYRIVREIGSLAAAAGGLDTLVFTAGVGEHAAQIRAGVCQQSAWLGIVLDPVANAAGGPCISAASSRVAVWVIGTDEDLMIARHMANLLMNIHSTNESIA